MRKKLQIFPRSGTQFLAPDHWRSGLHYPDCFCSGSRSTATLGFTINYLSMRFRFFNLKVNLNILYLIQEKNKVLCLIVVLKMCLKQSWEMSCFGCYYRFDTLRMDAIHVDEFNLCYDVQHGFARNVTWNLLSTENQAGSPSVTLDIEESEYSQSMWGHAFKATYKVALEAERLRTELIIKNTDTRPFFFTTALHTYFSASIGGVSVKGLKGCRTLNKDPDPKNPIPGVEERYVFVLF
ncbi:hypothetical protein O6H91_02G112100 [Diphasiastrum complanatum]|uniref:Uncharacterized protein n=1 Tax=Diphasiastrum complanatum TaxID=34168 RepID=A0ACC2EJS6_DIPCM|nr:hypothetical protein O6H91_02G112100 [Diphasiastrum complanatum]